MMSSTLCTRLLLLPLLFVQAPDRESIDTLIKKLGSPHFRERETATQRLLKLMPDAAHALKRALQSNDPEVARRAAYILNEFEQRLLGRSLKRLQLFVAEGKVDLAVELLGRWPKDKYEDACWQEVRKLVNRISASFKLPKRGLDIRFANDPNVKPMVISATRATKDTRRNLDGLLFVRARDVCWNKPSDAGFSCGTLIFATRKISTKPAAAYLQGATFSGGSVVIDGDVSDTIIVADGKILVTGCIKNCVIVTRGTIQYYKSPNGPSTMVEEKMRALGYIQFFDPTKEGITVEQAKNAVRIKQLAAKKPYANAGLKNGDTIISINGGHVASPENFRRVLRKHVAWEEEMTFRVVRDGKQMEIKLRPLVLP